MTGNIYLTGFMGSGKSTTGEILADLMRRRFVDMDREIAEGFNMSISEIFRLKGEDVFRQAETSLLRHLSRRKNLVVATGGGVPALGANRRLMESSGKLVYMAADLDTCAARLGETGREERPMWKDETEMKALYSQRENNYESCNLKVNSNENSPDEIALEILSSLVKLEEIVTSVGGTPCKIIPTFDGPGILNNLIDGKRVLLLTDENVARFHLERYLLAITLVGKLVIPPGEKSKTLSVATQVFEALREARMERDDILVALGGGMITDLGGFVAATYKRGINYIPVSTSLVGCVDASIGGKTAVNLGQTKNIIGTFTVPTAVVLDLAALRTLPLDRIADGLVEAYKTGLVTDPDLATLIETENTTLMSGELLCLARVAGLSAKAKAGIVETDFRESGMRKILNLGHTYGHAIESLFGYKVSHGVSVGLGIIVAINISLGRRLIDEIAAGKIITTIKKILGRKVELPSAKDAWETMLNDKKNVEGSIVFILLEGSGAPLIVNDVSFDELDEAVVKTKDLINE